MRLEEKTGRLYVVIFERKTDPRDGPTDPLRFFPDYNTRQADADRIARDHKAKGYLVPYHQAGAVDENGLWAIIQGVNMHIDKANDDGRIDMAYLDGLFRQYAKAVTRPRSSPQARSYPAAPDLG